MTNGLSTTSTANCWRQDIRNCIWEMYMKAKYYDILSDFYDTRLDGQYASDNEYRDLAKLKRAIDKSIFHLKLSQNGHKKTLLIRYTLNKINVLIRSTPEKTTKIKRLLDQVKGWIEKNADAYSSLRRDYCLSAAWYYTLSNPCKETAEEYCRLGMPDYEENLSHRAGIY